MLNLKADKSYCDHEFVWREYPSQPYGTCAVCGAFVLGNNDVKY